MSYRWQLVLVAVLIAIAVAAYWAYHERRATTGKDVAELERALIKAKDDCVRGPPMGPACVEAARLTTEIAKRQRGL